jgi:hypothetical protein
MLNGPFVLQQMLADGGTVWCSIGGFLTLFIRNLSSQIFSVQCEGGGINGALYRSMICYSVPFCILCQTVEAATRISDYPRIRCDL